MTQILTPATPVLNDMIGSRIEYVHSRPYRYEPIIATGTITEIDTDKHGTLLFRVKPDAVHLCPKWRSELDLLHYLPRTAVAEVATPAA